MSSLYSFHAANNSEDFLDGIFAKIKSITNENIITEHSIRLSVSNEAEGNEKEHVLGNEDAWWKGSGEEG